MVSLRYVTQYDPFDIQLNYCNYTKTFYSHLQVCTGKVEIVTVSGDHRTILTGDSVQNIVAVLEKLTI